MSAICQTLIVATLAAFIILFLGKTGLRIKLRDISDKSGIRLLADMLDCDFCLSFWISLCLSLGFLVLGYEISIIVPFCATPIARYLL